MELWSELFSDWVGILSFAVIAIVILIAIVFIGMFVSKSAEPPQT